MVKRKKMFFAQVIKKLYCHATDLVHCQYIGCGFLSIKKHVAGIEIMTAFLFSVCTQSVHSLPIAANQQQKGIGTVSLSIFVFIVSHITIATFIKCLWCEEMKRKRMRNPYKRKLKPSITCEPLFSSPMSVIKLPRSTEGLSCIWTPCWALLSADVFTVSQPPVWIERRRDDNDNKKLHFIAAPGGRLGGGVQIRHLTVCASHVLLLLLFAHLRTAARMHDFWRVHPCVGWHAGELAGLCRLAQKEMKVTESLEVNRQPGEQGKGKPEQALNTCQRHQHNGRK